MEHLRRQWVAATHKTGSIEGYLRQVADMARNMHAEKREGWKFHSIEEVVLHYGRPYTPGPRADDICQGEMQMCYMNAMKLVMDRPGLTYVEGYANTRFFPMGHGWATADGRTAIDPTWTDGTSYFGIPLNMSWWSSHVTRQGTWGIFFQEIPNADLIDILKNGLPSGAVA